MVAMIETKFVRIASCFPAEDEDTNKSYISFFRVVFHKQLSHDHCESFNPATSIAATKPQVEAVNHSSHSYAW
jgi:hypothetical protein